MTGRKQTIVLAFCALLSAFLLYTGLLLMFFPELGEGAFGVALPEGGATVFHQATGVRQLFLGLLVGAVAIAREFRALGFVLLLIAIVPAADAWIVLTASEEGWWPALTRHAPSVPVTLAVGFWLVARQAPKTSR